MMRGDEGRNLERDGVNDEGVKNEMASVNKSSYALGEKGKWTFGRMFCSSELESRLHRVGQ